MPVVEKYALVPFSDRQMFDLVKHCLLYTSDAADES